MSVAAVPFQMEIHILCQVHKVVIFGFVKENPSSSENFICHSLRGEVNMLEPCSASRGTKRETMRQSPLEGRTQIINQKGPACSTRTEGDRENIGYLSF